jgi:hypothetical protein
MATCILCKDPVDLSRKEQYSKLTEKGCAGINNANRLRNLDVTDIVFSENNPQFVHKTCRSKHTNLKAIQNALKHESTSVSAKKILRSQTTVCDFKANCLLCGAFIDKEDVRKHPGRRSCQFSEVMTLEFQKKRSFNVLMSDKMIGRSPEFWLYMTYLQKRQFIIEIVLFILRMADKNLVLLNIQRSPQSIFWCHSR